MTTRVPRPQLPKSGLTASVPDWWFDVFLQSFLKKISNTISTIAQKANLDRLAEEDVSVQEQVEFDALNLTYITENIIGAYLCANGNVSQAYSGRSRCGSANDRAM